MTAGRPAPSILFLDKVFLKKRRPSPLRGVELFNLALIRDLLDLGLPVTIVAVRSWKNTVLDCLGDRTPNCIWTPSMGIDFVNGLLGALNLKRHGYHTLLLGNVGNGVMPTVRFMHRRKVFSQCVLIAHREASERFVGMFENIPGHVLAVNSIIAAPFEAAGCAHVHVDYGIMNADRFAPDATRDPSPAAVRCCVIGMLDNAWKGADTVVNAFRSLPERIKARAQLHLCSFTSPPSYPEVNITAYAWMNPDEVPALLQGMDILIVPSRDEGVMRETFSQAVVQGMLTGLPVIVSDRPILVEKVDEGGGMVFHNKSELVNAITRLTEDPSLRKKLGAKARATALERYVWDTSSFVSKYITACRR